MRPERASSAIDRTPLSDMSEETMDRMAFLTGNFGDRLRNCTLRIVSDGEVHFFEIEEGVVVSRSVVR